SDCLSKMEELDPEPCIPLLSLTEFEGGNQCPAWNIPNTDFIKEKHLSLLPMLLTSWREDIVEDLVLKLGKRQLRCNRLLLMCHSEYAVRQLKDGRRELVLPEDRISWRGLQLICEWIKKSNDLLQRRHITTLLSTALFLEIEHLVNHIWHCLDLSDQFHEDQAFVVSQDSLKLHLNMPLRGLDTAMLRRVRCFFLTLVSSSEFVQLTIEHICALLSSDELSVNCEKEVFFAALRWLSHDWAARKKHLMTVMQLIRLPLLLRKSLLELRRSTDHEVLNLVIAQPEFQKLIRAAYSDFIIISNDDSTALYKLHCSSLKLLRPVRRFFICHDLCTYHRLPSDACFGDFSYEQFLSYLRVLQQFPDSWKTLKAEKLPSAFDNA
ncbi:hypothetical protein KR093_005651, partial [Drosophila rubida]